MAVRDPERLNVLSDCLRPNGEPLRTTPWLSVPLNREKAWKSIFNNASNFVGPDVLIGPF